jgi:hypothetical protein
MKNAIFWDVTRCVALVSIEVSEKRIASIIRVRIIGEIESTLAVTSISSHCVSVASYCKRSP